MTEVIPRLTTSRFNWFIPLEEGAVIFNGFTGAVARVHACNTEAVAGALSHPSGTPVELVLASLDPEIAGILCDCGFIVPDDFDEREQMRVAFEKNRNRRTLPVNTVVITLDCNFSCSYCFQKESRTGQSITTEVIDRIAEIVGEPWPGTYRLTLYGGEPLLYPDKCHELCEKCAAAARNRGGDFEARLITNGYLLDERTSASLRSAGLSSAQITLDWPRDRHNRTRPLRDGSPTFDRVLNNVRRAAEHLRITVRCNVEDEEFDPDLAAEQLEGLPVQLRFAPVLDYSANGCSRAASSIDDVTLAKDSRMLSRAHRTRIKLPCAATHSWEFGGGVVCPDGSTLRCWSEVGREASKRYGDVWTSLSEDTVGSGLVWLDWDPYREGSACYECRLLPNCAGGCPYFSFATGKPSCLMTELTLKQAILAMAEDGVPGAESDARARPCPESEP